MGVILPMFFLPGIGSCSPAGIHGSPAWERALPKGIAHFPALLDGVLLQPQEWDLPPWGSSRAVGGLAVDSGGHGDKAMPCSPQGHTKSSASHR